MLYTTTLVGDFETTVYEHQEKTEVWASALVEIGSEDVKIFHSLPETFNYLLSLKTNITLYYHNLKFDGHFWLDYIMKLGYFTQALNNDKTFIKSNQKMPNNSFKYLISDMGMWYSITIKVKNRIIEIRDSLKLLPFSVKRIGESFGTKHKKLDMEYKGYRYAGCVITDKEKEYIANDVLVVKEALEIMFAEGHQKLTIGSCCYDEFKKLYGGEKVFHQDFPDLTKIELDPILYGSKNADEYIRKSYHGGWCYVAKGKESKIFHGGLTADVNSLYPSMMSGESGNIYPLGKPFFWTGELPTIGDGTQKYNLIDYYNKYKNIYFFIRIRTRFELRKNHLPTVQIKGNKYYKSTEWLETSDIRDSNGIYHTTYLDDNNVEHTAKVTLTLTMIDYFLMKEHYHLYETEILDGCYFEGVPAGLIFDSYMEKYKKIKMESKGAKRELAKLFLNSLYGKTATSTHSDYKIAVLDENGVVQFVPEEANDKKAGFIAVGSAITSYARNFTIRTAQKNYHGVDQRGFIYADTDSIHCDLSPDELVGVPVHNNKFCYWKLETTWDEAIFIRQKTYIEHIVEENLEKIDEPYYNVKCAGMPDRAKDIFLASMGVKTVDNLTERQKEFVKVKRTLKNFEIGLEIPEAKLMPKRIEGGVILVESDYKIRKGVF